jgi:hypothetical protein
VPHTMVSVYLVNDTVCNIPDSLWQARCNCGHTETHVLLSQAQRRLDDHAGIAAVSHVHTAEMLES